MAIRMVKQDNLGRMIEEFVTGVEGRVAEGGYPMPKRMGPVPEDRSFPEDLTRLHGEQLGQLHSYWTAQLAWVHSGMSRADTSLLYVEEQYNRARAKAFIRLNEAEEKKVLKDVLESKVEVEEEVAMWKDETIKAQALVHMMQASVKAVQGYTFATSREQTRRKDELELGKRENY